MARVDDSFTRADLELLHVALSYMRKRIFDQGESVRVTGMIERIEDLLLAQPGEAQNLRLSPPEQGVLRRQVFAYCDELTHRGAATEGREQAKRLREIVERMTKRPSPARSWFRRLWGG
jgi:hypothetical protein